MDMPFSKLELVVAAIRTIDENMPLQQLAVFIRICSTPGLGVREISQALNIAESTASRHVSALGDLHWLKKPGLHLVEYKVDPMDLRKKQVVLTSNGKQVAEKISSILTHKREVMHS